ncbi:tyrosine-type recombinase/integrase [Xanthobacter oligotrophicus]|uniref:Tyrosine-type recombinase/integrase n=1 Tax=Xanthobacter oligotrophicus TaxID=2607286 RepID=A0ABW6ZTX2_9HYPH
MPKLTKSIVEAAAPRDKQFTIWCSELPGFGVYVLPSSKRTYFVDYRNADGVRRRMTIGRHGALTCEEARKLAIATMGEAVKGEDPALERATRRKSLTVAELCERYLAAVEKGLVTGKGGRPKKPASIDIERGRINRHIVPLLGKKLVIDLKSSDIARFIKDVTLGKTAVVEKTDKKRGKAVVEGGAGTAGRTAALFGGILSFAVDEGVISENPSHGVKRPTVAKRNRRLSADEFKRLGDAIAAREGVDAWQGQAGLRLIALTGCRLGEIAKLKWSEVDIDGQALRLTDTKTGPSVRPLGKPAADILRGLIDRKGGDFVLPGARNADQPFGSLSAVIEKTMAAAGLDDVTAHTLRHSFASVAGDLDFTESTIGVILGHSAGSTTSRYVHRLDSVLIAAANKIANEVHRQMTGEKGKVVPMPGRNAKAT